MFEYLRREFPYVHVSAETKRRLLAQYRHQMKYIMSLVEPVESRKIKIRVRGGTRGRGEDLWGGSGALGG